MRLKPGDMVVTKPWGCWLRVQKGVWTRGDDQMRSRELALIVCIKRVRDEVDEALVVVRNQAFWVWLCDVAEVVT